MLAIAPSRLIPVLIALLLSLGCATPTEDPIVSARDVARGTVSPPYYRIEGPGGATLLVMGTIHVGPAEGWKFSPAIRRGLTEADSFILEIDVREATDAEISTFLAARVVLPTSVTIDDVVSPETAKLLTENDALLGQLGMPAEARLRLKPWFIAVGLMEAASGRSGYSGNRSAESAILAMLDGRPLAALESLDAQLALLDSLSPVHQDLMLRDTLSRLDAMVEGIEALVIAWGLNDQPTLAQIALQGLKELPELEGFYEILLGERNRNWARQLSEILEDPERAGETIFVGVGALHLVGADSLISILEAGGYRAESLDENAAPAS